MRSREVLALVRFLWMKKIGFLVERKSQRLVAFT
jgi:hypothetical protein